MKVFSDACEYALRATVWLANQPREAYKVRQIADATHSAPGYLVKVLQRLVRAGILSAQRGSQGGFTLKRDPETLGVLEIINAVDPIERISSCPLSLESHVANLCPLHRQIDEAIGRIETALEAVTIAALQAEQKAAKGDCKLLFNPAPPQD